MFEANTPHKSFIKTTKQVIKELEDIKDIEVSNFKDAVEDAFDRYNVDGIEELIGFDTWTDITNDAKYELNIKIDHEDAYEFTLYTTVENNKATITNVL
jgi:uncharacterized protein YktA (UPF0223 family)